MIVWLTLMLVAVCICSLTLVMTVINLAQYRPPPTSPGLAEAEDSVLVSVCIPARDEEENLEAIVRSVLASEHRTLEVLVYDDESEDDTPRILARLAAADERVRPVPTMPLPAGWIGKQHACWRMAAVGRGDWLLFTDADVRFAPDCVGRALAAANELRASMVSTIPRQITGTLGESLIVPLVHFVLFSYLPMPRMRASADPAASAGCGQFLLVRRDAYDAAGGHAAVRDSMHEGVKLPRLLRRCGHHTDLFDGTGQVSCRMYRGLRATWRGFAKNAYEGLGSIWLLLLLTALHLVGHVLPCICLTAAALGFAGARLASPAAVAAIAMALVQRFLLARRFRQSLIGVLLHPIGITVMTLIQWHSLALTLLGMRQWRGRVGSA